MKSLYKIISIILVVLFSCVLFTCGTSEEEQPHSLIFPDLEPITGTSHSSGGSFNYYLPPEVAYAVLGIFDADIETEGNMIKNEINLYGGSRTGLDGWTRGSVANSKIWTYNQDQNDFNYTPYSPGAVPIHWAVWGYDKYGNLTHASEQIDSTF